MPRIGRKSSGAVENLGAYGLSAQTWRYWMQQLGIGYGVIALESYLLLMVITVVSIDTMIWFPFWLGVGGLFAAERVITVWRGGWVARGLAALVLPELLYSLFLCLIYVKGVADLAGARDAAWHHDDVHQSALEAVS